MPDALMYDEAQHFVVLESDQPEVIVTVAELREKLTQVLGDRTGPLPRDLQRYETIAERVDYLIETSCDLDMGGDRFLQWYAVRLEK
jgi:hypothetical protein